MESQSQQAELIDLFQQTGSVLRAFVANCSAESERATGTTQQWSAKDLLSMISFWLGYTVDRMATYARGEIPARHVDFDAVNRAAYAAQVAQPWDATVIAVEAALDRLSAAVRASSDELLATDNVYGDGPGDPLWGEVRANGFIWPLQEIEKFYRRTGEADRAAEIQARLAAVIGAAPAPIVCDLIAPHDLRAMQQGSAEPIIIDVRGAAEYARGHVLGARHIALDDLPDALATLPHDRPIVTYCNMHHPGHSRGEHAAALLHANGYQAQAIAGGLPAWQAQGLPIEGAEGEQRPA